MAESERPESCRQAIQALIDGDVAGWSGLPEGCSHDDLAQVLEGGAEEGNGRLSGAPVRFRMYSTPKQAELIQAWFDGSGHAFLITFSAPRLRDGHDQVLGELGQPDTKLEPGVGFHADAYQWVYASRGLTLFVREHLNEIARVAVYHPTTPSYYEQYLGGHDRRHYLPHSGRF